MLQRQLNAIGATALLCLGVGCHSSPPAETAAADLPPPGADQRYEVELPKPPPAEAREIRLDIDDSLDGCGLEQTHFPYDESTSLAQDAVELRVLADCVNAEPYRESKLLLIGRADPRGPSDYNRNLGAKRAEFVKGVLEDYGVSPSRISVTTQGESDAKGDAPEYSYGYDRRVDVVQLMVHAP